MHERIVLYFFTLYDSVRLLKHLFNLFCFEFLVGFIYIFLKNQRMGLEGLKDDALILAVIGICIQDLERLKITIQSCKLA